MANSTADLRAGLDFDLVIAGDFRFPGGTSSAIAEAIRAQASLGYRCGLLHVASPLLPADFPIHPDIQACLDSYLADPIQRQDGVTAALLEIHNPLAFRDATAAAALSEALIVADRAVMVAHHPPVDGAGRQQYDSGAIDAQIAPLARGGLLWAPVSPSLRRQLAAAAPRSRLTAEDWPQVIDATATAQRAPCHAKDVLVIGRHARPHPQKWPDTREAALLTLPDDPGFEVQVLGAGPFLTELMRPLPANWLLFAFNEISVPDFLAGLDAFVYYHHSNWIEGFGRNVMEAMAAGLPCILPPSFAEQFGEGAIYARPEDVRRELDRLRDPTFRDAAGRRARNHAEAHFAPAQRGRWLEALIGPPAPRRRRAAIPGHAMRERVLMLTSNGTGMGHLTRQLAIARRLPQSLQPVIATMSQAMPVVLPFGYLAEYIPSAQQLSVDEWEWNGHLAAHLDHLIDLYRPSVLIFDGNRPYDGLIAALGRWPGCKSIWSRRAMWRADSDPAPLQRAKYFDIVLEPGEIAAAYDCGPSLGKEASLRPVGPILLLDGADRLPRDEARRRLGLRGDTTAVLIQLGSGSNQDLLRLIEALARVLVPRRHLELRLAEWLMAEEPLDHIPDIKVMRDYPIARFINAFDFAISAAGYNSYHELAEAGVPTLFIPNLDPTMDDQMARARFAADHEFGLALDPQRLDLLPGQLAILLDPQQRQRMQAASRRFAGSNGAAAAAGILAALAQEAQGTG